MHCRPGPCTALLLSAQLHCVACRWAPSRREAVSVNALFLDDKLVCDSRCPDAAVSLLQQTSRGAKRKWPNGEWNFTLKSKLELQQQKQQPDQRRDQQNTTFGTTFPFHSLVHLNSSTSNTTANEEVKGPPPPQINVVRVQDLQDLQTALRSRHHDIPLWLGGALVAFLVVGVLVAALVFTAVLAFQRILGATVAEALREALRWKLCVPVRLGHVSVSAFKWTVQIHDLVLQNPEGFSAEEALMSAELISVSPEVLGFVLSKGRHLTISELILSGVAVHVEYRTEASELRRTNVGEVLHQLKSADTKRSRWLPKCFPSATSHTSQPAAQKLQSAAQLPEEQKARKAKTDVVLRRVLLEDLSLRLAAADLEGPRPELDLGRLEFGDFSREGKFAVGHDVLAELLRTSMAHMLERMKMREWLELVREHLRRL